MASTSNTMLSDSSIVSYNISEPVKTKKNSPPKIPAIVIGTICMTVLCIALVIATSLIQVTKPAEVNLVVVSSESKMEAVSEETTHTILGSTTLSPLNNHSSEADDSNENPNMTSIHSVTGSSSIVNKTFFNNGTVMVESGCMRLEGIQRTDGSFVFKRVPYAQAPVGRLRWSSTRPVFFTDSKRCNDPISISAKKFGAKCAGRGTPLTFPPSSEDCLFLNIWTPSINMTANLPVIVYMGEIDLQDNNSFDLSLIDSFVLENNVVFLNVQYREGIFGDLLSYLPLNDSQVNTTDTYMIMDQVVSLEWLKENIVNFGGDPNAVTLIGHGQEATNIYKLLVSQAAQGLFHRIWLASVPNPAQELTNRSSSSLFLNTGCNDIECLYGLSTGNIIKAFPPTEPASWKSFDPFELKRNVMTQSVFTGNETIINVPIIIGSSALEIERWLEPIDLESWSWTSYVENMSEKFSRFGSNLTLELLRQYKPSLDIEPDMQFRSLISDMLVTCYTEWVCHSLSSLDFPVYRYVITSQQLTALSSSVISNLGIDMLTFFGGFKQMSDESNNSFKIFRQSILDFVRTGNVTEASWLLYPSHVAVIGANITFTDHYHKDQCHFWKENGFIPEIKLD